MARSPEPQMVFVPGEHSNGHLTRVIAYVNKLQYNTTVLPSVNTIAWQMFCGAKYIHLTFTPIIQKSLNYNSK